MTQATRLALQPIELFGIRLVGVTPENGRKLLISLVLVVAVLVIRRVLRTIADRLLGSERLLRARSGCARPSASSRRC